MLRDRLPDRVRRRLSAARAEAVRRYARSLGYDVVRRGFYSPLVDSSEVSEEVWTRRSALEGIAFDPDAQLAFVCDRLAERIAEFDPGGFDMANGAFQEVDSELAYAMVRHLRPHRLVELGSGFSSLVLARACERNRSEGSECEYRIFDPFPRDFVQRDLRAVAACERVKAQKVPAGVFDALTESDVLFVDTTHTVKTGSDVNRIVLDLLPRLAAGVVVHFHDVFLPWEYHRHWIEGDYQWNEQYMLQAFLSMNPGYEVLLSSQALVREHAAAMRELVPALRASSAPSSLWLRRVSAAR